MIRHAPRRRVLFAPVIALVCLVAVPIDECDDYAFLHAGAAPAHAEVPHHATGDPDERPDAGSACQHVCSCLVCVLTTDDSYAPRLPSPQLGETVSPPPTFPTSSSHLPDIYRPPIA